MKYSSIKSIACLISAAVLSWPAVAQQAAQQKTAPQKAAAQKAGVQKQHRQAQQKQGGPLRGKLEKLSCKLGSEDRHARIAVEVVGGRVKSIAYYSKWKPRTCSVHIVRDDAYSKWEDTGSITVVTLNEEKGSFLIDADRSKVKFLFRDIDRERFCGMEGKITGSLTVTRGKSICELEGVMDEGQDSVLRGTADAAPPAPQTVPGSAAGPL